MVLGKLPLPGCPTNSFNTSRARAYCACSRCGLFGLYSLICYFSLLSPSLWETARYRLKYCLKGAVKLKTNQPTKTKARLPTQCVIITMMGKLSTFISGRNFLNNNRLASMFPTETSSVTLYMVDPSTPKRITSVRVYVGWYSSRTR